MRDVLYKQFSWIFYIIIDIMSNTTFATIFQKVFPDYTRLSLPYVQMRRSLTEDLPDDCLLLIFEKLEQDDLLNCTAVCKRWKTLLGTNRRLWNTVNFQVGAISSRKTQERASSVNRKRTFSNRKTVQFLVSNGLRPKVLTIQHNSFDTVAFRTLATLIASGSCQDLTRFSIKWYEEWNFSASRDEDEFHTDHLHFLNLMALLKSHTGQSLSSMTTQLYWTTASLRHLCEFKHLSHLEVNAFPRVHCIYPWQITKILEELCELQSLKLTVTINPQFIRTLSFKSQSLTSLDISDCVNLFISEMELPNLRNYMALNVQCHRAALCYHTFCLHAVLAEGCPRLETINNQPLSTVPLEQQSKICFCHTHKDAVWAWRTRSYASVTLAWIYIFGSLLGWTCGSFNGNVLILELVKRCFVYSAFIGR